MKITPLREKRNRNDRQCYRVVFIFIIAKRITFKEVVIILFKQDIDRVKLSAHYHSCTIYTG